ncbi:unnamed protein product, partial [Adineta steineri]
GILEIPKWPIDRARRDLLGPLVGPLGPPSQTNLGRF